MQRYSYPLSSKLQHIHLVIGSGKTNFLKNDRAKGMPRGKNLKILVQFQTNRAKGVTTPKNQKYNFV